MKMAIVLGGGGSKGAYQIGAWRALKELGIKYDIITGTSIGAFNGAMMVQGDFEKALALWREIDIDKVILNGLNLRTDFNYYKQNSDKLIPFLKSYANHKGMDITPLKKIVESSFDEAFFTSSLDYGLVSVKIPSFSPIQKRKSELNKENLALWILASASCFPAFPVCEINGESYIDGGYYDNLPVNFAFELGAEQVIAIALNPNPHIYSTHPLVSTIQPIVPLGGMLDFDKASMSENMEIGYLDTLKSFGKLWGRIYSFRISKDFMQKCALAASKALAFVLREELHNATTLPFNLQKAFEILTPAISDKILRLLSEDSPYISHIEQVCASDMCEVYHTSPYRIALHLIEAVMLYFGDFKHDGIYEFKEVCRVLKKYKFEHFDINIQSIQNSDKALLGAFFGLFLTYLQKYEDM
ncbi:patatin-like phospholipase family protein [Helicobacter japonicus]|uniref:patatin-like phospholipase family protein n=1 Tax=Helicobacter japonicus TaxID=425400 RepID=UPI0023F19998|nr:patatin-like phospholipase family protein [Helicobacter japonicus]